MSKKLVSISKIFENPNNPRFIKNHKFDKLVNSIKELPKMLKVRPIVVDENMVIQGGNMRYKACIEAGLKEVWIDTMEDWTEEEKREFIIRDNVPYGEWDFDMLVQEYDALELDAMGIDLDPNMFRVEAPDDEIAKETANPKFNDYTLYFENEEEMDIWYGFLGNLKNKFPDQENISERVLRYIAEIYEENGMKESKRILKFLEVNGEEK